MENEIYTLDELLTVNESFIVVLDSRNGYVLNGSYNSEVEFQFEGELIFDTNDYIQLTFAVNSFSMANCLYVINENNNLLSIILNGITYNYYIDYGNYNIDTFKTYLLTILPNTFLMTYSTVNNKNTITNTTYDFIINNISTIYEVMGFSKKTYYTSTNKILILPYTCNFNGIQNINISWENLNTDNLDSFTKAQSNIIQNVSVDSNKNIINYIKANNIMIPIKTNFLDSIIISLKDDLNNSLNLNNQHFNLTLQFNVIKDINRFKQNFHHIMNKN
jgi:hypothetical protein